MTLWAVSHSDGKGTRMGESLKSEMFRFLLVGFIWLFAIAAAVFVQAQPRTDSRMNKYVNIMGIN